MSVTVDELVPLLPAGSASTGAAATEVTGVHHDSRRVAHGDLFCCVPGATHDGHDHAAAAVAAGAVALLTERRPPGVDETVPELRVPSVRAAMGPLAARVHEHPSHRLDVIGVTGTNGKTSVVHLLDSVLDRLGVTVRSIGTLTGARTTPEAPELQAELAAAASAGVQAVAMEVSSHALDLHRIDGTRFAATVFTNLGHDHLDHHGTMEAYEAAKARLFSTEFTGFAAICTGDEAGRRIAATAAAAGVEVVTYHVADVDDLVVDGPQSRFRWRGHEVVLRLAGSHNVANAIAVGIVAERLGHDPADIADALCAVDAPRGRFEFVAVGQPFHVVVDYAHKPEALASVLVAARQVAGANAVHVVVGCGGDRDRQKRPLMARAAIAGADRAVFTSDNPRSEDPATIVDEMLAGLAPDDPEPVVELDRRTAIGLAIDAADRGDVVVIAGKGHEEYQVIGDEVLPFDDRAVAAELLLGGAS